MKEYNKAQLKCKEVLENPNSTPKEARKQFKYMLCTNHEGKMSGVHSISTSVLENKNCQKRRNATPDKINPETGEPYHCICTDCYAASLANARKNLDKKLEFNTEMLTARVYPMEWLPTISTLLFRGESFGDLQNGEKGKIQAKNYFNLFRKNPLVKCALWTKNPWIIAEIMEEGYEKPENLQIVYSNCWTDYPVSYEQISKIYPFIDRVFNIFSTEKTAEKAGKQINCGARDCLDCNQCYRADGVREISEKLKDAKRGIQVRKA